MAGTIAPNPVFTGLDSNGDPLAGGLLYTYQAGTTTAVATYTDSALSVPNANPIVLDAAGRCVIYLTPGSSYKFLLKTSGGTTVWTQDNISAVPASNVDVDITGTAGESLTLGQICYLSSGAGGTTTGRWYRAKADAAATSTTPQAIGFCLATIATGESASFRVDGRVTGLSGATTGATYFISSATAGDVTSTAPSAFVRVVGVADSITSIVIRSSLADRAVPFVAASEVTIASDAITVTQNSHRVDTESDAATDTLTTITAGAGITPDTVLVLRPENTARVVTMKTGGNLLLNGDYQMNSTSSLITLIWDGTNWREVARSKPALSISARAYRNTSTQSINSATITKVQFNAESWDTHGAFDSTTNFNFTVPEAGKYLVNAAAVISGTSSNTIIYIYVNDAEVVQHSVEFLGTGGDGCPAITALLSLSAGNTVDIRVQHSKGSAANLNNGSNLSYVDITKMAA